MTRLLHYLRDGDKLVIRKLDRIAGSEVMAIQTIAELHDRGVQIKSLTAADIDTTTPMGRAPFGFVAVLAQVRVDTIRENTPRGLAHARAQGRVGSRPSVMTPERDGRRRQHALRAAERRDDHAGARRRCILRRPCTVQVRQGPRVRFGRPGELGPRVSSPPKQATRRR